MSTTYRIPRSPELMDRTDTGLLVVDVQTKLLAAISDHDRLLWNIERLIEAAHLLGIPTAATEQYPKGLGPTAPSLTDRLGVIPSKRMFSCRECDALFQQFRQQGRYKVLVAGIETHVCVQQTVLDLLGAGFRVFVALDATRSRFPIDQDTALRRMESSGATLTTTESALFEWCETAAAPEFTAISLLVKQIGPTPPKSPA